MAGPWNPRPLSPLRLSPVPYSPSDFVVLGSSDEDGPEVQLRKKRKRELLGQEYLRGRPPTILTAGLRGPFDNGWKNPWTKKKTDNKRSEEFVVGAGETRKATTTRRSQSHMSKNKSRPAARHHCTRGNADNAGRERLEHIPDRGSQERPRTTSISKSSHSESEMSSDERVAREENKHKTATKSRTEQGRDRITASLAKLARQRENQSDSSTPSPPCRRRSPRNPSGTHIKSLQKGTKVNEAAPLPLESAMKEASRIRDPFLREQTLKFCGAADSIAKGVGSLLSQSIIPLDNSLQYRKSYDWVQPLQGIAYIAEMAQKLNEEMSILARMTVSHEPVVIPTSSDDNAEMAQKLNKEMSILAEMTMSHESIVTPPSNEDNRALPSTDPGPSIENTHQDRKAKTKVPRRMSFSASGRMVLEVRVPLKPSQHSVPRASQKPSTTSDVLPEAQVTSKQPGQKLPSWPSTNLLETDQQSLKFHTAEGDSEVALSTQAALKKAHHAFQLDLDSPAKVWSSSPDPSQNNIIQSKGKTRLYGTASSDGYSPQSANRSRYYGDEPANTQALVDKLTPFAITTVKKSASKNDPLLGDSPLRRKAIDAFIHGYEEGSERSSLNTQTRPGRSDAEYSPNTKRIMQALARTANPEVLPLSTPSQNGSSTSPEALPDKSTAFKQHLKSQKLGSPKVVIPLTRPTQYSVSSPIQRRSRPSQNTRTHFSSPTKSQLFLTHQAQSQESPSRIRTLRSFQSALSGTTPHQDGQQRLQRAGWSLDDAIDDAGSFLGTWDLEKEVRKSNSSSSRYPFRNSQGKGSGSRRKASGDS